MKDIYVVGAALIEDGKILITKRSSDRILGDLWEFPGGKIEAGEDEKQALIRELEEEFNDQIQVGAKVATGVHTYDFGTIHLTVYLAKLLTKNFDLIAHSEISWAKPEELLTLNWAEADIPAAQALSQMDLTEVKFDE